MDLRRCSISGGDFWIGLAPDPDHGRVAVERAPAAPKSVLFLEGPEQDDLIADFVQGPWVEVVENLVIGTSHGYIRPEHPTPYDFTRAVAALNGASMPALKRLSLGDMELLFNGHGYYGRLGDIAHVFDMAPQLEEARICCNAELSRSVQHEHLRMLVMTADYVAGHCAPMSQATFTRLLTSRFRSLTECDLSLEADEALFYQLPEAFFRAKDSRLLRHSLSTAWRPRTRLDFPRLRPPAACAGSAPLQTGRVRHG
jgi:hypothetical protein